MSDTNREATESLIAHLSGDAAAIDELLPLVYDELRALAAHYVRGERAGHTLQPTALVNEAYLRLIKSEALSEVERARFLAIAARTMRRVLVDHARARVSDKRGGGLRVETLIDDQLLRADGDAGYLALDVALEKLTKVSPRQSEIIELRFFGGLSVAETAVVLDVGIDRVKSDWRFARAWLELELENSEGRE